MSIAEALPPVDVGGLRARAEELTAWVRIWTCDLPGIREEIAMAEAEGDVEEAEALADELRVLEASHPGATAIRGALEELDAICTRLGEPPPPLVTEDESQHEVRRRVERIARGIDRALGVLRGPVRSAPIGPARIRARRPRPRRRRRVGSSTSTTDPPGEPEPPPSRASHRRPTVTTSATGRTAAPAAAHPEEDPDAR